MEVFAKRTGLSSDVQPRRYLWTDAFAVCNFLGLEMVDRAKQLVDDVHQVLGKHRPDDERTGWISGLDEDHGARLPTIGGLRIGKPLAERGPGDPFDQRLEWDRDGQYFHYLTKWIWALDRMSDVTQDPRYHRWAVDLARVAHERFTYRSVAGTFRMYWKMSIDLERPLVSSMGHHDPLDGLITYAWLASAELDDAIGRAQSMCQGRSWITDDALGLGGLLFDAHRVTQLAVRDAEPVSGLAADLLQDTARGLGLLASKRPLSHPAESRLAFRELGLSIGLRALPEIRRNIKRSSSVANRELAVEALDRIERYAPMAERIESFWLVPEHRAHHSWVSHHDINDVMLATSLSPHGFLGTAGT